MVLHQPSELEAEIGKESRKGTTYRAQRELSGKCGLGMQTNLSFSSSSEFD